MVDEDGTADRVRADFWSDALLRHVAAAHPAPVVEHFDSAVNARNRLRHREDETVPVDVPVVGASPAGSS